MESRKPMKRYLVMASLAIVFSVGFTVGRLSAPARWAGRDVPSAAPAPSGEHATRAPAPKETYGEFCPVTEIVDGDTFRVWFRGAFDTVRLLNINTPERDQAGFKEATEALRELVGRGPVWLEWEQPGEPKRGRYGRLLAYAYLGETCVNVDMVRRGWSTYWTKYGESRLAAEFRGAEEEARSAKRGLWAAPEATQAPAKADVPSGADGPKTTNGPSK